MKFRPVGGELFRAERRTDTTKLIIAFSQFANAPKDWKKKHKTVTKYIPDLDR